MKTWYVYVDDIRKYPPDLDSDYVVITCRTYAAAIETIKYLSTAGQNFVLDLDHDLGETKTGYDICKFIVENELTQCGYIILHTQNAVCMANMKQLLSHYGYAVYS